MNDSFDVDSDTLIWCWCNQINGYVHILCENIANHCFMKHSYSNMEHNNNDGNPNNEHANFEVEKFLDMRIRGGIVSNFGFYSNDF